MTHETNRFQHATLIVSETIAANASLQKSEALLKKTMTEYSLIQEELSKQGKQIQELSANMASKAQLFNQKIDSILPLVHDTQTETARLNQQQKITTETLTTMNTALQAREQTITTATERVASIGQVTQQFANDVVKIQQSQNELSHAVTQFSLFVNEHSRRIPPSAVSSVDNSDTSTIVELKRQNAEDAALIREWVKSQLTIQPS